MSRPSVGLVAFQRIGLRSALRVVAGLASLCALVQVAGAQTPPLTEGARVRVVPTDADLSWAVEGRLVRLRADSVTIELSYPPGRVRGFCLDGSWRVEVAGRGHRHVGRRALWGAGIGAVAVGVLAAASYEPCTSQEFLGCMLAPTSAADAGGRGALGGAVLGGVVGLVVGLVARDVEWLPVGAEGVRVGLAPLPAGRTGLGAAFSF